MGSEYQKILEVTTRIGCSNMCEYCPQVTLIGEYRKKDPLNVINDKSDIVMSLDSFKKCLETIPTDVDIHFAGYTEPFENPNAIDMIEHATSKGHKVMINTTLVGMTKEVWGRLDRLDKSKLKDIHLHLPSASYDENIGVKKPVSHIELDGFKVKELSNEYAQMLVFAIRNPVRGQSGGWAVHLHCHGDLHPQLSKVDENLKKADLPISRRDINSRAMNLLLEKKQKVPDDINIRGKCSRVSQNILLPDGRLALCCQDYGLDQIMGNLLTQTWGEYIESDLYNQVLQEGADLCDYCEEGISYVDDKKWEEWRGKKKKKRKNGKS